MPVMHFAAKEIAFGTDIREWVALCGTDAERYTMVRSKKSITCEACNRILSKDPKDAGYLRPNAKPSKKTGNLFE